MRQAGAHYVVDSIAQLMPCLEAIGRRLAAGERP
jgi:phosphonoacetaldehyde hydrolase